jgi:hypothetical protein
VLFRHGAVTTTIETAFDFLSSDEFKGADKQNTIWLSNFGNRDVSPINCLTIIRPPGNMKLGDDFASLANAFSPKILEKLTYVWVTEKGEKFSPSRATDEQCMEGMPNSRA